MSLVGPWTIEDAEIVKSDGSSFDADIKGVIHCNDPEDGFSAEGVTVWIDGEESPVTSAMLDQASYQLCEGAWNAVYISGSIPLGTWRHKATGALARVLGVLSVPGEISWLVLVGTPWSDVSYGLCERHLFEDGLCEEAEYELVEEAAR